MAAEQTTFPPVKPWSDEWILLRFIRNWTPDIVHEAIHKKVDLADLFLKHRSKAAAVRAVARRNKSFLEGNGGDLGDNVLSWFKARRPDLYDVIVGEPGGEKWIRGNAEKLRNVIAK